MKGAEQKIQSLYDALCNVVKELKPGSAILHSATAMFVATVAGQNGQSIDRIAVGAKRLTQLVEFDKQQEEKSAG